ncbi:MAG: nitroreductase family deazaflavin-dependent oxidoreductase [Terrimesophilobacter sp.]
MAGSLAARMFRNRRLIRAPIGLYRAGLGWIFGRRLVMLEHTGRNSGAARFVVLEVVARQRPNEVVIASALGRQAQWFQNLVAEPRCRISTGVRRRVPATAEILDADAAAAFLVTYQSEHPALWKELEKLMSSLHDGDPDFELPLVRLTLHPGQADT